MNESVEIRYVDGSFVAATSATSPGVILFYEQKQRIETVSLDLVKLEITFSRLGGQYTRPSFVPFWELRIKKEWISFSE